MIIFIDESGGFTGQFGTPSLSLVGSMTVLDSKIEEVVERYLRIRPKLPKHRGEVKGRLLGETHVSEIVTMLRRNQVIFEATAVEMGVQHPDDVRAHIEGQTRGLTVNLGPEHHENIHRAAQAFQRRLLEMPPQLYVQSLATFELMWRTVMHCSMYFSQRQPKDIGRFEWVVDAKQTGAVTDWEDWWTHIILPWTQSKSLQEPMAFFMEGDYSAMDKYLMPVPDYMKAHVSNPDELVVDCRKVLANHLRFSSDAEPGLELVDVLVNATRRAFGGNLQKSGWKEIPRLMIQTREQSVQFIQLGDKLPPNFRWPYDEAVKCFRSGGRTMLAPRFR